MAEAPDSAPWVRVAERPDLWARLDPGALGRLVDLAVRSVGGPAPPLTPAAVRRLYAFAAERRPPEERRAHLREVIAAVGAGETGAAALVPFLSGDGDSAVVARAAGALAVLLPAGEDALAGAREVLRLADLPASPRTRAAIHAGLLHLGDRRVAALLDRRWHGLDAAVRLALAGAKPPAPYAAVIEAQLGWLETVDERQDRELFDVLAGALAAAGERAATAGVTELEQPLGRAPGGLRILRAWSREEYAVQIGERLARAAAGVAEPERLASVLRAWGVAAPPAPAAPVAAPVSGDVAAKSESRAAFVRPDVVPQPDAVAGSPVAAEKDRAAAAIPSEAPAAGRRGRGAAWLAAALGAGALTAALSLVPGKAPRETAAPPPPVPAGAPGAAANGPVDRLPAAWTAALAATSGTDSVRRERLAGLVRVQDSLPGLAALRDGAAVEAASGRGMVRLTDAELREVLGTRARVLRAASVEECAGYARGTLTEAEKARVLARLPAGQLDRLLELSLRAAALEAAGGPLPPPRDERAAFQSLLEERLTPAERARLAGLSGPGPHAPGEDCALEVTIMNTLNRAGARGVPIYRYFLRSARDAQARPR